MTDVNEWREEVFLPAMRADGLGEGSRIVDYGCSVGNYTFPMAELTGDKGIVYAVDINRTVLREVAQKARRKKIANIQCMMPQDSYKLAVEEESVDAFLIYDLFHMLKYSGMLDRVLGEADRVLKTGGILSILPFHMSAGEKADMCTLLESRNYELAAIRKEAGLHFEMQMYTDEDDYEKGDMYQFRKKHENFRLS